MVSNDHLGPCQARIFQGLHAPRRSLLPTIGTYQAVAFETISYPWSFGHPRDDLNESRYGGESLTIILALVKLESSKGYMLAAGPNRMLGFASVEEVNLSGSLYFYFC